MQNAYYQLLKKYAKMMTEQEYSVGKAAKLLIETAERSEEHTSELQSQR